MWKWERSTMRECLQMGTIYHARVFTNGKDLPCESVYKWEGSTMRECLQMGRIYRARVFTNGKDLLCESVYKLTYSSLQTQKLSRLDYWSRNVGFYQV
jgi:hypothetical protein